MMPVSFLLIKILCLPLSKSMAIASKGKGKSGGARVITYNLQQQSVDEVLITLMTIYDKSDISNVSDAYLRSLVQDIEEK